MLSSWLESLLVDCLFLVLLTGEVLAWLGDSVYWLGGGSISSGIFSMLARLIIVLQVFLTRCPVCSHIFVVITPRMPKYWGMKYSVGPPDHHSHYL